MTHQDKYGNPKLVKRVGLPITAPRCVKRVITDIAVIDLTADGLVLREVMPGWSAADVQSVTEAELIIPADLAEITL